MLIKIVSAIVGTTIFVLVSCLLWHLRKFCKERQKLLREQENVPTYSRTVLPGTNNFHSCTMLTEPNTTYAKVKSPTPTLRFAASNPAFQEDDDKFPGIFCLL